MAELMACSVLSHAPLHVTLRTSQAELLMGEPLKLAVTLRARSRTGIRLPQESDGYRPLRFFIDGGSGPREYFEYATGPTDDVAGATTLNPGEEETTNLVLAYGRYAQAGFPFPHPGNYSVRVQYAMDNVCADSGEVSIRMVEPESADERSMYLALRKQPLVLKVARGYEERAKQLIAADSGSRYLRWPRLKLMLSRRDEIVSGFGGEQTNKPLPLARLEEHKRKYFIATADDLAEEDWGAFEEERLLIVSNYLDWTGHRADAAAAELELLERFPESAAAKQLRKRQRVED